MFISPGPILEPEGTRPDYWRFARALYAAGFRPGDLVHNAFAYHLTPAGSIIESAARALGCPVIPAGTGQTEQQLARDRAAAARPPMPARRPSSRSCSSAGAPSGVDTVLPQQGAGRAARPSRGRSPSELRGRAGIDAYQSYGTADLGLVAYETPAREGLVVDEGVLVEIVRPGTGDPVPAGRGRRGAWSPRSTPTIR